MKTLLKWLLAGVITTSLVCNPSNVAAADDYPDIEKFKNADGKLTQEKSEVFTLHTQDKTLAKWDKDLDGNLSPGEAEELRKKTNDAANANKAGMRPAAANSARAQGIDISQPLSEEEMTRAYRPIAATEKYEPGWFRTRGRVSDFAEAPKNDDLGNVAPAIFSWGHDFLKDGDTWAARGAVGAYWNRDDGADFGLGADFDRVSTDVPGEQDVDTLVFRAFGGMEVPWKAGALGMDSLLVKFEADYGTNFSFNGGAAGGAIELEPGWSPPIFSGVWTVFGVHGGRTQFNSPAISMRNILRIEGGTTVEDFQLGDGQNGDYLRGGGSLEMVLWPFGTESRMSMTAAYGYLAEITGNGEDYHNFKAGVEWRLDELGHFSLRLEYVDGLTPLVLQEQQNLLLSLSVRF